MTALETQPAEMNPAQRAIVKGPELVILGAAPDTGNLGGDGIGFGQRGEFKERLAGGEVSCAGVVGCS
ncbi:MAG: hypothetical protein HC898_01120 [Phycisphaerales bacterium]|nr:hypothetical protein [Phycisphaerales bacterium]